jgi:hypothetical protein
MSDSPEPVLYALKAVDRARMWSILGVAVLFVITALSAAALFASAAAATRSAPSDTGVMKLVFVGSSTTMLFTACCAVVVMFHISRSTKALIRALDLYRR